jgi:type II secretory pathway pseudopilin PulG
MTLLANHYPHRRRRAFALVLVLIILTLLAVVSVGFLASMSAERTTANAFSNKTKAEQAAQAGVDSAMATLREYIKSFPDSATVWDTQQSTSDDAKSPNNEGTSLYLRAVSQANANLPDPDADNSPSNVDSSTGADKRSLFVLPLVSGAVVQPVASKSAAINGGNAMPVDPSKDSKANNFVDLNSRRSSTDIQGWMGSSPEWTNPSSGGAPATPKPVRVPWVEIKRQDGITDPAKAPVIARYAYWVEDESFRANINYAGLGKDHKRSDNTTNVALDARNADLIAPFIVLADSGTAAAQSISDVRDLYPFKLFPEFRAYAHATGLDRLADQLRTPSTTPDSSMYLSDRLRYLTTTQSAALNLSRHGTQRLNLNTAVNPTTSPTDTTKIQRQIDKIVNTIKYHAPDFGQRFYRKTWIRNSSDSPPLPDNLNAKQVTSDHALIYLYKIAANIRDYMDTDLMPTVIKMEEVKKEDGSVVKVGKVRPNNSRPMETMNENGDNLYWAVGKDSAPFLSECGVHYSGGNTTGIDSSGGVYRYELHTNYFIELWNMSTKKFKGSDLGAGAFIRVINPTVWLAVKPGESATTGIPVLETDAEMGPSPSFRNRSRDFDIDISNVEFSPGVATVIVTDDPNTKDDPKNSQFIISSLEPDTANQSEARLHFVPCKFNSPGTNIYKGKMPTGPDGVVRKELKMLLETKTNKSDYETEVLIGTANGYIDCLAGGLPLEVPIPVLPTTSASRIIYGGYLRGNLASNTPSGGLQPSAIGDPRTNNEQLVYTLDPSGDAVDRTRYTNHDSNINTSQPVTPTFGIPNYRSAAPDKAANPWPDYYKFPGNANSAVLMNAQNAPSVILNGALTSIGQLGDIYDPARLPATTGGDVAASRGGGRTLRIGQHDDRYDGLPSSASSAWASWRLTDIFSTTDSIDQPGAININGLARDNGAALYAALMGFKFQPVTGTDPTIHGDLQLNNRPNDDIETQQFIKALVDSMVDKRLKNTDPAKPGPFFERGEISETPILNPSVSPPTPLVSGVDMAQVIDHSREEIVRRLIEMTTTRGNVFTVYAMGQSITQSNPTDPATKHVTGTHQMKVTFRLVPKNKTNADGITATDFHPGINSAGEAVDFDPDPSSKLNKEFAARFAKPDHYDIQILSASSGL